jgi:hypothetical protein
MKIDIHISDAKPEQLVTIAKALGVKMRNLGSKTQEAPYGKRKDGTPRKKPGRPVGFSPKKNKEYL